MPVTVGAPAYAFDENDARLVCVLRMADFSVAGLRVVRVIAQAGSFSAAADALGYTQSAVSRQVASLETVAGRRLFERGRAGVTLTPAGARLLPRAIRVLDELDAALREDEGPVRLGAFATAIAGLVPRALAGLPVAVTLREGTTPALVRALRAGTLDLAVLAQIPPFRPPGEELELTLLAERELALAVPSGHAFGRAVEVEALDGQVWVASPGESLLGVWPGLRGRPDVRYVVRDWLGKLQLVAAGLAITTLAPVVEGVLPDGVRVVAVRGEPVETRRLVLAHRPRALEGPAARVADALLSAARGS
jgi:DNA-binding transcriptional LysR family regulator